jgi:hypothetical protein
MKVQGSDVALWSTHHYEKQTQRTESLKIWDGNRSNEENQLTQLELAEPRTTPTTSLIASRSPSTTTAQLSKAAPTDEDVESDADLAPEVRLLKLIMERLFGKKINLMPLHDSESQAATSSSRERAAAPTPADQAPQLQGWGMQYDLQETEQEVERLAFSASGKIQTADGEEINFELRLNLQREYSQSLSVQVRAGDVPVDPLVINFNGQAAELTQRKFQFDLDADGDSETIASVKAGSAFLVLDKNSDGKVNDGGELFGPKTGSGFAELSRYDSDQNNWIDENDAVYHQLRLWNPEVTGDNLSTLQERNIGAIYLKNLATPFSYKGTDNESVAELAATSVVLGSDNSVGTVQQLNLVG